MTGRRGFLKVGSMLVYIEIMNVRKVLDKIEYQVTAVEGISSTWVESSLVLVSEQY